LLKIFTSDVIEFYYSLIFTSVSVVWTSVCLGEFFRLFSLVNKSLEFNMELRSKTQRETVGADAKGLGFMAGEADNRSACDPSPPVLTPVGIRATPVPTGLQMMQNSTRSVQTFNTGLDTLQYNCPSVCPSVTFRYHDHICWNTSKIISPPNSDKIVMWRFLSKRRLLLCLHTFFRALIYWAHRAVIFAIAWHLVQSLAVIWPSRFGRSR